MDTGAAGGAPPGQAGAATVFEEFDEGDPRRGPHSPAALAEAAEAAKDRTRWHRRNPEVDWFAVKLTLGRGFNPMDASRAFAIGESRIYKRANLHDWQLGPMPEEERRELAAQVWLAGVLRYPEHNAERRARQKAASEWSEKPFPRGQPLPSRTEQAAQSAIKEETIPDDAYFSDADPKREERRWVMDRLEARLRELEAQQEALDLQDDAEGPDREGEGAYVADEIAGGMGEAGRSDEGVERLCEDGPASA
jgi:hypothetical protein